MGGLYFSKGQAEHQRQDLRLGLVGLVSVPVGFFGARLGPLRLVSASTLILLAASSRTKLEPPQPPLVILRNQIAVNEQLFAPKSNKLRVCVCELFGNFACSLWLGITSKATATKVGA